MISSTQPLSSAQDRDCVLVVAGPAIERAWRDVFRCDYSAITLESCPTYLSAIAEATRRPVRAALAHVDPTLVHLEEAVAGLREAIGSKAKLVLCCAPAHEPIARALVERVADDYLLLPLDRAELDRAIGYARPGTGSNHETSTAPPVASMDELEALGTLFSGIDGRPTELLERLASTLRRAVKAGGVTVIVEGAVATSGDVVVHPVLSAPLVNGTEVIGQLTLGARTEGAYTPGDAEKLTRYASLAGAVLTTASKHRRLRHLADTDACSGLPNRRFLYAELDCILERARRDRLPVTALIFDIDNFKDFNDRLGHDVGDRIIRTVGQTFRRLCRTQDVVARLGGDEFAVVFWDPQGPRSQGSEHPESALAVLDRVRDALRQAHLDQADSDAEESTALLAQNESPGNVSLTISGGLATFPWDATTRHELLLRADEALLNAKRAGKNRVFVINGTPSN